MQHRTILFIHQAFPGQFRLLAQSLVQDGHTVYALALNPQAPVPGVQLLQYPLTRPQGTDLPYLLRELDAKLLRGESAHQTMLSLRAQGVNPDVVYAHPGWGEALFVKNVWPKARLVIYAEWFYNLHGQEVNFDPECPPLTPSDELRLQLKNTVFLHALNDADAAISPTAWQKSRFPAWAQEKIQVIHDGLELPQVVSKAPKALRVPAQNLSLHYGMPIVTFVARHLEPVRGFHTFMRALPKILKANPNAHILIIGKDAGVGTGYGQANTEGKTWRQAMQDELGSSLDLSRVHFLGFVDHASYLSLMRLSACHVYLTTPFILSWSFLESIALGVPVVASDVTAVQEYSHIKGVELIPYGDVNALAQKVVDILARPLGRTPNDLVELGVQATLPRVKSVLFGGMERTDVPVPALAAMEEKDPMPQRRGLRPRIRRIR